MSDSDTRLKLKDAATQLQLAVANLNHEETFRSCVNSFISTARSITFVMERESSGAPTLHAWYKNRMETLKGKPVFKFFHNKRTHSIHYASVRPKQMSASIRDLRVGTQVLPGFGEMKAWVFDDIERWIPGSSGNVVRLCEEYLQDLIALVVEWEGQRSRKAPGTKERVFFKNR